MRHRVPLEGRELEEYRAKEKEAAAKIERSVTLLLVPIMYT